MDQKSSVHTVQYSLICESAQCERMYGQISLFGCMSIHFFAFSNRNPTFPSSLISSIALKRFWAFEIWHKEISDLLAHKLLPLSALILVLLRSYSPSSLPLTNPAIILVLPFSISSVASCGVISTPAMLLASQNSHFFLSPFFARPFVDSVVEEEEEGEEEEEVHFQLRPIFLTAPSLHTWGREGLNHNIFHLYILLFSFSSSYWTETDGNWCLWWCRGSRTCQGLLCCDLIWDLNCISHNVTVRRKG